MLELPGAQSSCRCSEEALKVRGAGGSGGRRCPRCGLRLRAEAAGVPAVGLRPKAPNTKVRWEQGARCSQAGGQGYGRPESLGWGGDAHIAANEGPCSPEQGALARALEMEAPGAGILGALETQPTGCGMPTATARWALRGCRKGGAQGRPQTVPASPCSGAVAPTGKSRHGQRGASGKNQNWIS